MLCDFRPQKHETRILEMGTFTRRYYPCQNSTLHHFLGLVYNGCIQPSQQCFIERTALLIFYFLLPGSFGMSILSEMTQCDRIEKLKTTLAL